MIRRIWRRLRNHWIMVYPGGAFQLKGKHVTQAVQQYEDVSREVHGADGMRVSFDYNEQVVYCTPWHMPYPNRSDMH